MPAAVPHYIVIVIISTVCVTVCTVQPYRPTSTDVNRHPVITSIDEEKLYRKTASLHRTVKMNLSEIVNEGNLTFERFDVNETEQQQLDEYAVFGTLKEVFLYVSVTLGIPGNILSAIVWLRLHVASQNSSAVYLAALAINDIVHLLLRLSYKVISCETFIGECVGWIAICRSILLGSTTYIEPVLVLGFSVERLTAISCPLKVYIVCVYIHCVP